MSENEINPAWAAQFADAFGKALDSRLSGGARVIQREDTNPDPSEICTEDEGRKYDRFMGSDFYRLGDNGKPNPEFRYRFAHWHPQYFSDASVGNGSFRGVAYIEKFKFLPEPEVPASRVSPSSERPRKVFDAFFVNCREFFKTHTPCLIEFDPEEIQPEQAEQ